MPKRTSSVEAIGMLPKNDERPPFFPFAVSLYRSDLLFRSLTDLAIATKLNALLEKKPTTRSVSLPVFSTLCGIRAGTTARVPGRR
jgi:hypothetical protein